MSTALLLVPDFLLIALGYGLCRWTALDRPLWQAVERLVYTLLFPTLLFASIVRTPLHFGAAATFASAAIATTALGIALALALGRWPRVDPRLHASGAQVAYRFNSYVALALAERLGGAGGVAAMAICIAICVPLANVAAVWPLARHGGHSYARELVRNPLIVATLGGIVVSALGVELPALASTTLQRIGGAALPLGLMAAGAGLRLGRIAAAPGLAAALLSIRHAVLPAFAIALGAALRLPVGERLILALFAALPTSSASYVLAARMGGDGPFVAGLVTLSTLLGAVSVPAWLALEPLFRAP